MKSREFVIKEKNMENFVIIMNFTYVKFIHILYIHFHYLLDQLYERQYCDHSSVVVTASSTILKKHFSYA